MTDKTSQFAVPTAWQASYTQADREAVARVVGWLNERGQTRSWLCRASRVSAATAAQLLNGKYPSAPAKWLKAMEAAIETQSHRDDSGSPSDSYVETSIYRLMAVACDRARYNASFSIVTGYVGVGKTAAIKHYAASHPHTVVLEANPDMSPGVMLTDLLTMLSAAVPRSLDAKFSALAETLAGTNILLIIDEAETMQPRCLHYLRRIRDKAAIGIVMTGTERLMSLIKPVHGAFDQIRSRVCFWPANIQSVSREDADVIARSVLAAAGASKAGAEVLDALWTYSEGSARMLTENLIPALRDYVIAKDHPLTGAAVDQVAEKVLRLPMRRSRPVAAASDIHTSRTHIAKEKAA